MKEDKSPNAAWQAILVMFREVTQNGQMLSDLTRVTDEPMKRFEARDRAMILRTVLDMLRNFQAIDVLLADYIKKPPKGHARNILRLAITELYVQNTPAYAVADKTVAMMKSTKTTTHMAGLANAVIRKLDAETPRAEWLEIPAPQMPSYLRKPLINTYGLEAIENIEKVQQKRPPTDFCLNAELVGDEWANILQGELLPTGSIRRAISGQISELPGYSEGAWWVQDAASSVPVMLLGDIRGKHVLDLCAAPGGKTMQLCAQGAKVTVLDISVNRLKRLQENLKRTGFEADIVVADLLTWEPEETWDIVLLDAPCSATGTIRRHPDLPYVKANTDIRDLVMLQREFLSRASNWVSPNGTLLYCTCSLLPQEGEKQVSKFLKTSEYKIVKPCLDQIGLSSDWISAEGGVRLRPDYWQDKGGMDGFYLAILEKNGQKP